MILIKTYLNAALEGRNQISSPLAGEDKWRVPRHKGEGAKSEDGQHPHPAFSGASPNLYPAEARLSRKGEGDGC